MRHLIAFSAFTLMVVPPGFAQDASVLAPGNELNRTGITAPLVLSSGYAITGTDILVSKLLDQTVFTSIADDAGEIGTITNLVVTPGLGISAVVISVGGFLGVGTKDIAVDFNQLQWIARPDGGHTWVLSATPDALMSAPAFIWADSEEVTGEPALTLDQEEQQRVDGNNDTAVDPDLTTDQPERQNDLTPADRAGEFNPASLSTRDMLGIGVYGVNGQQVGTISDILRNPDDTFDAVIIDVGGFLGLGAKPVAVGSENLKLSADTMANGYLFLNATRQQLEAQTAYDPATYKRDRAIQRMVVTP